MVEGKPKSGDYDWDSELQPGEKLLWVGRGEPGSGEQGSDIIGATLSIIGKVVAAIPLLFFGLFGLAFFLGSVRAFFGGSTETDAVSWLITGVVGGLFAFIGLGGVAVLAGYPLYKRRGIRSKHYAITDRRVLQAKNGEVTYHPLRANMTVTTSAIDGGCGNIYIFNPMEKDDSLPARAADLKDIDDCPTVVNLLQEIIAGKAEPERQDSRSWEDYLAEAEQVHWYGEPDKKGPREDDPAAYAIVDDQLLVIADKKLTVLPIADDLEVTPEFGADDFGTIVFTSSQGMVTFETISGCTQVVEIVEDIKRGRPEVGEPHSDDPEIQDA